MAHCSLCNTKPVFASPMYCKEHFILYIEEKVKNTILRFNLIQEGEKIAVAVSGGKDSQTVLYILHKLYGNIVFGIAIDEGIPGYRDKTLDDLERFCNRYSIPFTVSSFKERYGKALSDIPVVCGSRCSACGVLRRSLLNEEARGFDKLATGHNLDDECQSILMNLLKGNLLLSAKLGPRSGIISRKGFVQRIKPLYLCTEKEIATYAFLKELPVTFIECPHAADVFRSRVRDGLNMLEMNAPETKKSFLEAFLRLLPSLKELYRSTVIPASCMRCGGPSMNGVCKACTVLQEAADAY